MPDLRVLIVDDASFVRDMVKRALRTLFPQLTLEDAINGRKAQMLMAKSHYDLILCDWEMPEMSGLELLRWARMQEVYKKVPFVMITSRGDRSHIVEAVQEGVSDYLAKPFSNEQLAQKVIKAIGRKLQQAPRAASINRNALNASASVLTAANGNSGNGSAKEPLKASAAALTPAAKPEPDAKPKSTSSAGKAQVRFADSTLNAVIKSITLTEVRVIARRDAKLPAILDQAVVDIALDEGATTARLNGYVHQLQAVENRIDTDFVSIVVRFVDEDPEKLEQLSKFIAKL